ncbi:hypothetical protein NP233_g11175 [Leucocoprinus birnbaumii]|uniref:Uncharacterized protein n=1 Tax=Leucocoprinus birnbaumii TaxID=56174 RepID=A0AAD5VHJ7_9AGAR|nr:hypothetical protein NP233_g11175 [Leucocoprinus birnbaumii]
MAAAVDLAAVFGASGVKEIGSLVKGFDFSKIDVQKPQLKDHLCVSLAPSYGKLDKESVKQMDGHLKVMIAGTMRSFQKKRADLNRELTWEEVMSVMMQNSVLEAADGKVDRSDTFTKPSKIKAFKFDGSADDTVVKEVQTWFTKLIGDPDILKATKIDIKVLAEIVAQTGATVDSFEAFFYKNEHHEKGLIDIGVLRFPDIDNPYFKVYRIQLRAWSACARYLFVQEDQSGITGEFNARNFRPRESVLSKIKKEIMEQGVEEAEALFG